MIKLSKKWDYAIKTIIYLASDLENNNFLKISEISEKLWISESLLRRIISELEKSRIIKTIKGRNGWISIWKDLNKISIYDILESVWEELWITDCTKWISCDNQDCCETTHIYGILQKWLNWILKLYTLDRIVKKLEE